MTPLAVQEKLKVLGANKLIDTYNVEQVQEVSRNLPEKLLK